MIDALERRAERGVVVGADETWRAAHGDPLPPSIARPGPQTYRLVLAACAALVVGVVAWGATGTGTVGTASATEDVVDPPDRTPVILAGMTMVEAYRWDASGPAETAGAGSIWDVYTHPDGAAAGIVMISTSASGGLDVRSAGVDGRMVVESAAFVDGAWRLDTPDLVGPVDRFTLGDDSEPGWSTTFIDTDTDASVVSSNGPMWAALHGMLSGEQPPALRPVEVLGIDGLGVDTAFGMSIVLWADGDHHHIAQSPAHALLPGETGPTPLSVDQLLARVEVAEADEWLAAVERAMPSDDPPFFEDEDLVFTIIVWCVGLVFTALLFGVFFLGNRLLRRRNETA